jgi:hypothetical protein
MSCPRQPCSASAPEQHNGTADLSLWWARLPVYSNTARLLMLLIVLWMMWISKRYMVAEMTACQEALLDLACTYWTSL